MITEGYLARHYQGRAGGRDPALHRYRFLFDLDQPEARFARCNPGDRRDVEKAIGAIADR